MNIFGVGLPEMAVIGAVALLVFGPKRLPELCLLYTSDAADDA